MMGGEPEARASGGDDAGIVALDGHGVERDEILRLRASIDNIDAALMHLLAERFKCTQRVGELKAAVGLPPADPARDAEQISRLVGIGRAAGLDPAFAEKFREFIVAEVKRRHAVIATQHGPDAVPPLDTFS